MKYYIQEQKVFQDLTELWSYGVNAGIDAAQMGGAYKDEYQNAILQGYTKEMARKKALYVIGADMVGGFITQQVPSALATGATAKAGGIGDFVVGTLANSIGGAFSRSAAGDWFDKKHGKGKYEKDAEGNVIGKPEYSPQEKETVMFDDKEHAYDIDEFYKAWEDNTGMKVPELIGGERLGGGGPEQRATDQRHLMGVYRHGEDLDGSFFVDPRRKENESDEAYKNRMKDAKEYAARLNKEFGYGNVSTDAQETQPELPPGAPESAPGEFPPTPQLPPPAQIQPAQPGQQGVPPVPELPAPTTGPNAGQTGPGITTPTPENQQVTPEVPGVIAQQQTQGQTQQAPPPAAEPGQQLTPMQQWAQKYPHLAKKVKQGQAGYDEISKMNQNQSSAQQQAAKVRQQVQQARQDMDRAAETRQRVATQNAQSAENERKPTDPILRTASRVRDAGQKYGDKAFSSTLRPQKAFEPLKKKKIGDPLGESVEGLMDFLLD